MKITAVSDLHGNLIDIDPCDILLIGGDICPVSNHRFPFQRHWYKNDFVNWLKSIQAKNIVFIAGNHDFYFADPHPNIQKEIRDVLPANCHYLNNDSIDIDGIKIFGTPWTNKFGNWAFMDNEDHLVDIFSKVPDDTDIILSHGPAYGACDIVLQYQRKDRLGSHALMDAARKIKPKYVISGHIHSGCHIPLSPIFQCDTKFVCVYQFLMRITMLHTNRSIL